MSRVYLTFPFPEIQNARFRTTESREKNEDEEEEEEEEEEEGMRFKVQFSLFLSI